MAKQGMSRPDIVDHNPHNPAAAVPLIQGKAKCGKERANPVIGGTESPSLKVFHDKKNNGFFEN